MGTAELGEPATIEIVQDTDPDGPQDFAFTLCPADADGSCLPGATSFSLDDDADTTVPRLVKSEYLPGRYAVTQSRVDGWSVNALDCTTGEVVDRGQRRVLIELGAGEQVQCTFTLRQAAIRLVQDTVPNGPQDFVFDLCATTGVCQTVALDDDTDPALGSSANVSSLEPGTYTVTQREVDGFGLTAVSCTSGDTDLVTRAATVTLVAGDQAACTFVTRPTSLTIIENTTPNGPTAYAYTRCLGDDCLAFSLDDDTSTALPRTTTWTGLTAGTYIVTQGPEESSALTSLTCDRREVTDVVAARATIQLTPGEAVTCTFSNRTTALTIGIDATPNDEQDFEFSVCPVTGPCRQEVLDDMSGAERPSSVRLDGLSPGVWTVAVDPVAGWGFQTATCGLGAQDPVTGAITLVITTGMQLTCTVKVQRTSLTVVHDSDPISAQDFTYTACTDVDPACTAFVVDDDNNSATPSSIALRPTAQTVTYVVRQTAVEGWGLVGVSCTSGEPRLDRAEVTVTLRLGETATCTFVSRLTTVTINQDTQPNAATAFGFTGCAGPDGANGCGRFTLDDDGVLSEGSRPSISFAAVPAGVRYTVTQDATAGQGLVAINCSGATVELEARRVSFTLSAGDQVSCTFVNRPTTVTIVQDTAPNGPQDFTYLGCQAGVACQRFSLDDDTDPTLPNSATFAGLDSRVEYTVAQDELPGFGVTLSCSGGIVEVAHRRATIVLDAGEQVTCTFVDTLTTLTIIQDTQPNGPQDFTFTGCSGPAGAQGCGPFVLDDDTDAALAATVVGSGLAPNTYSVTQEEQAGWGLARLTCAGPATTDIGARRITVVLAPGDQVVCTFANAETTLTIIEDVQPDGPQDFRFAGCREGACGPFLLDDDADPTNQRSVTLGVVPGPTYTITQQPVEGFGLVALTCTGGDVDRDAGLVTVVLTAGERVTCTFVNRPTTLTIVQQTAGDGSTDFLFTGCAGPHGANGCSSFALDDDDDPMLPDSVQHAGLRAGMAYTVSTGHVDGWGRAVACDQGEVDSAAGRFTVVLAPGDQVTCTFTRSFTQLVLGVDSSITMGADVGFEVCRDDRGECTTLELDADTDAVLPAVAAFSDIAPDTRFTITQTAPVAGFGLRSNADISCTTVMNVEADWVQRSLEVVMAAGARITCTFHYTPTQIELWHATSPDDGQDFTYTVCPVHSEDCRTVVLDDDSDPALPSRASLALIEGEYVVRQTAITGWGLASISCNTGQVSVAEREVRVTLSSAEQLVCTFTPVHRTLTVTQSNGYPVAPYDFSVCPEIGACHEFTLVDGVASTRSKTLDALDPGLYTITQSPVAGHGRPIVTCNMPFVVDPALRQVQVRITETSQAACTFSNDPNELTVLVAVEPLSVSNQDFHLKTCGPDGCRTVTLDAGTGGFPHSDERVGLTTGTYTITAENLAPGWVLDRIDCTRAGRFDVDDGRAVVVLDSTIERCTFTFRGTLLEIETDTVPDAPRDLTYDICPATGTCTEFVLYDDPSKGQGVYRRFAELVPGTYTITQRPVDDWVTTELWCSTGEAVDLDARRITVTVSAGEEIRCVFTNRVPSLSITLDSIPASANDVPFELCPAVGPCSSFSLDDDQQGTLPATMVLPDLAPGVYTVTQGPVADDIQVSITCSAGEQVDEAARQATITLIPSEQADCTFTHRVPGIVVVLDMVPNTATDMAFAICSIATGACTNLALDDDGSATFLANEGGLTHLAPGTYTITRASLTTHSAAVSCTPVDAVLSTVGTTTTVELGAGVHLACRFTYTRK